MPIPAPLRRSLGRNDTGDLCSGLVQEPRELARRRHQETDQLAAQLVEGRQRGELRDSGRIEHLAVEDRAAELELFVVLRVVDERLGERRRIPERDRDGGRALEMALQPFHRPAFGGALQHRVLRDPELAARSLGLAQSDAELLELLHGNAAVVGDEHARRPPELLTQLVDLLFFFFSSQHDRSHPTLSGDVGSTLIPGPIVDDTEIFFM